MGSSFLAGLQQTRQYLGASSCVTLGFVTRKLFWDLEGTLQAEVDLEMQNCVCMGCYLLCPVEGLLYSDSSR